MQLLQEIDLPDGDIRLHLLRLDNIHPFIPGNKYFKLKYNVEEALKQKQSTLLTFGGAYSNHIAATAAAGKEHHLDTIGIIRGEESSADNPTLLEAQKKGMQLHFVSREDYRKKNETGFIEELKNKFGDFYLIPEGGSNALAVKGCTEITNHIPIDFDYICCAVGTGGTLAGISCSLKEEQQAIGFSSLKGGDFLKEEVNALIQAYTGEKKTPRNFSMNTDYHFGGYAKTTPELLAFKKAFGAEYNIELDYIYTAKMMYGVLELIRSGYFKEGSTVIAVHSGGLQGNKGFELRLRA